MKIALIAGVLSLVVTAGVAGAEEPTAPAANPQRTESCVMNIQKDAGQCYLVKVCVVQTCDTNAGTCTWETSSEKQGGPIPCMPQF